MVCTSDGKSRNNGFVDAQAEHWQGDVQNIYDGFLHFTCDYYLLSEYSNYVSTVHYCIVERTQTDYASGLAAYSNNNCFITLLFLPQASCNGDLPLEFFTLASAPCLRKTRAISSDRKRVARCNGVSCSLFCAFTSAPRSSKRCARRTLPGWLDRNHDLFLRCT